MGDMKGKNLRGDELISKNYECPQVNGLYPVAMVVWVWCLYAFPPLSLFFV